MNSTSKLNQQDDEYASKKKKIHPRPVDAEDPEMSTKKIKTITKTKSKNKGSTHKKCEVTFSEEVEEINGNDLNKENTNGLQLTPFNPSSPSKTSLKSVKDHIKTPYSKVKDPDSECHTPIEKKSAVKLILASNKNKSSQPNFNREIIAEPVEDNKETTPVKSAKKQAFNLTKSRSKSPLVKINEVAKDDTQTKNKPDESEVAIKDDKESAKDSEVNDEKVENSPKSEPISNEGNVINEEENTAVNATLEPVSISEEKTEATIKCSPSQDLVNTSEDNNRTVQEIPKDDTAKEEEKHQAEDDN